MEDSPIFILHIHCDTKVITLKLRSSTRSDMKKGPLAALETHVHVDNYYS